MLGIESSALCMLESALPLSFAQPYREDFSGARENHIFQQSRYQVQTQTAASEFASTPVPDREDTDKPRTAWPQGGHTPRTRLNAVPGNQVPNVCKDREC